MNYTKQTFRIFYQHLAKYKLVGLILIFSIIIGAIISIIPPLFYKDFFNVLTGVGVIAEKVGALINILIKVLILYLIEWFFLRLANFFLSYLETRVMTDLSNTCFSYLHKHSVSFLTIILSAR